MKEFSTLPTEDPLVSVVIATKNRAELLRQSIDSVLNQVFENFELLIVDDGSTDNTREVVKSIDDSRIKYFTTGSESKGISAARNLGADNSRGLWTAVHDDDDLMLPHRLENQLKWAEGDTDFIYGAFVNFDDETGELQFHHGRNMTYGAALQTGFAPGHSTWLVKTQLIRQFRYDEGLESAVDNNLAFRWLRSGIKMVHSGEICLLRRVHKGRITDSGGASQKYAAQLNLQFMKNGIEPDTQKALWAEARRDWGPVNKASWQARMLPFLPDHLVSRHGMFYFVDGQIEDGTSVKVRVHNENRIPWREWYGLVKSGANVDGVHTRFRESDIVEDLFLNKNPLPGLDTTEDRIRLTYELVQQRTNCTGYLVVIGDCKYSPEPGVFQTTFDFGDQMTRALNLSNLDKAFTIFNRATEEGLVARVFEMRKDKRQHG